MIFFFFFFQAEDGIRDGTVTGVQTCALPILPGAATRNRNEAVHANPTLAASNVRQPVQNSRGRSAAGFSKSSSVGTDPLCRYGASAQMPSSGLLAYPSGLR